jgi:hypothetical protein
VNNSVECLIVYVVYSAYLEGSIGVTEQRHAVAVLIYLTFLVLEYLKWLSILR